MLDFVLRFFSQDMNTTGTAITKFYLIMGNRVDGLNYATILYHKPYYDLTR